MQTIRIPAPGGLTIVADAYGRKGAPTVVLGHGGGQTRHSWSRAGVDLATAGYHVLNYDLLGHGESDWEPAADYSLERRAVDVRAVVAAGSEPFALVGASLGGATALKAATQGLEPAAIVLVDIVPLVSPEGVVRIQAFMNARPDGFASLKDAADAIAAYNPGRERAGNVAGLAKNLRQGDDGRYRWHWDPRMMEGAHHRPDALLKVMDDADWTDRIPTMLVRGMKSDIVTDEGVADLRRRIPALEVVDIGGAGHMVAGDRNDHFNAAVIEFLARTMPPG
ncbi:alpha/beta fold hydrolase [Novosphingobium lentum]|uniref:alpha/beta fold hydrolase n=1 Tax=Novosphingobium lentum TaxID=145287 RepID=UPI000829FA96|nr:alpha/beta hydrolase [Novosphingobium lentum]